MKKQLKKSLLVMFSILGLAVPTITVGSIALVSCSSSDSNSNNTNNDQNNPSDPGGSGGTDVKPPVVDNYGRKYLEFSANIEAPNSLDGTANLDKKIYSELDWAIDEGKWFEDDGTPVTYVVKLIIDEPIYLSHKLDVDVSKPCIDSVDWYQSNFWRLMNLSKNNPLVMEYEVAKKTNDKNFHHDYDFNFKSIYYDRNGERNDFPGIEFFHPSSSFGEAVYNKKEKMILIPSFNISNNRYDSSMFVSFSYLWPDSPNYLNKLMYDDYKNFMSNNNSNIFFETDLYDDESHAKYRSLKLGNNADYIGKLEIYPKNKN